MKNFLGTFAVCFILGIMFLLFGGLFIFYNVWTLLAFVSFILAIFISIFVHLGSKLEELEERLQALEGNSGSAWSE